MNTAGRIIGAPLPSLQDIYTTHLTRKATTIVSDASHPAHNLFSLLPSGRRYRSLGSRTTRLTNSFIHQAVRMLNSLWKKKKKCVPHIPSQKNASSRNHWNWPLPWNTRSLQVYLNSLPCLHIMRRRVAKACQRWQSHWHQIIPLLMSRHWTWSTLEEKIIMTYCERLQKDWELHNNTSTRTWAGQKRSCRWGK